MHRSRSTRAILIVGLALALTGCTPLVGEPQAAPTTMPTVEPSSTPVETPEPTVNPVDPGDVTTWQVTAAGIGPIMRGADGEDTLGGLSGFEPEEQCAGVVTLDRVGTAHVVVGLSESAQVDGVWVSARPGDGTSSPTTPEGIHLGSSGEELSAAYPDLTTVVQSGADTWVYAVPGDPDAWVQFVVEDDVVVLIGAAHTPNPPKEWCA